MYTKDQIEALKKRATEVNSKIIQATTKKEMAQARVKELLAELGYDADTMSSEQILELIQKLESEENAKVEAFKASIEEAESKLANPV